MNDTPCEQLIGNTEWRLSLARIRPSGVAYGSRAFRVTDGIPPLGEAILCRELCDITHDLVHLLSRPDAHEGPLPASWDEEDEDDD